MIMIIPSVFSFSSPPTAVLLASRIQRSINVNVNVNVNVPRMASSKTFFGNTGIQYKKRQTQLNLLAPHQNGYVCSSGCRDAYSSPHCKKDIHSRYFHPATTFYQKNSFFPLPKKQQQQQQPKVSRMFSKITSSDTDTSTSTTMEEEEEEMTWETITSTKNPVVKLFKNLINKRKTRKEKNLTVLEGHRLVMDTLSNPRTRSYIQHVLVSRQALDHVDFGHRLYELLRQSNSSSMKVNIVSDEVLQSCTDTITPQGVVATCSIPRPFSSDQLNSDDNDDENYKGETTPRFFLVLDGVSDPGNVGTLLRSSAAVGVTAVILLPDCTDVWAPKAIRSGMGASFHVPIVSVSSLEECLQLLEECGGEKEDFYAATMDVASNQNSLSSPAYYEIDWAKPKKQNTSPKVSALCIGKEGPGLSTQVRNAVIDGIIRSVHVPMEESGIVESLNAAVCGSVILFEFSRQKRLLLEKKK